MGYRWRRMYYATGLPGWMRFGYSPGWIDRSPTGLPPIAEWLISSGQLPQYLQSRRTYTSAPPIPPTAPTPLAGVQVTKEQERQMLEQQVKAIESQLNVTRKRLEKLRESSSTQQLQQAVSYYPTVSFGYPTMPYSTPPPEEELVSLQDYRKNLDEEVKGVEARIEELKKLIEKKKAST